MKTKATFFLPLKDNDGRDLHDERQQVEEECFLVFGAWTLMGYFRGTWRMDDGTCQADVSAVYMVLIDDEDLPELEAVLRRFKEKTTQQAILLELAHGVDVRFI